MLTVQRLQRKMLQLLNSPIACLQSCELESILFFLPSRSLHLFIRPFLLTHKDVSWLLSFHLKAAKCSLQSTTSSLLNQLTEMWLSSMKAPLIAGKEPCAEHTAQPNTPVLERATQVSEVHLLHISLLLPLQVGQALGWPREHRPGEFISTEDSI